MKGILVRAVRQSDAEALLALQRTLDRETRLMMLEPGERSEDVSATLARIAGVLASPNSAIFVAEVDGGLAGYLEATGGRYRRARHSAALVLGVRQRFARQGVGRALLVAVMGWAAAAGVTRLELTVMAHNTAAIGLYRALGFIDEGLRRRSLIVDGQPVDELAMARLR